MFAFVARLRPRAVASAAAAAFLFLTNMQSVAAKDEVLCEYFCQLVFWGLERVRARSAAEERHRLGDSTHHTVVALRTRTPLLSIQGPLHTVTSSITVHGDKVLPCFSDWFDNMFASCAAPNVPAHPLLARTPAHHFTSLPNSYLFEPELVTD